MPPANISQPSCTYKPPTYVRLNTYNKTTYTKYVNTVASNIQIEKPHMYLCSQHSSTLDEISQSENLFQLVSPKVVSRKDSLLRQEPSFRSLSRWLWSERGFLSRADSMHAFFGDSRVIHGLLSEHWPFLGSNSKAG